MDDRRLSVDYIAQHRGVYRATAFAWLNKREMQRHKAGRRWKIRKSKLDARARRGGVSDRPNGRG